MTDSPAGSSMPLSHMEISYRTWNALNRAGIREISDLIQKTRSDILQLPRIGQITLNEIERVLGDMGLSLTPGLSDTGFSPAFSPKNCVFRNLDALKRMVEADDWDQQREQILTLIGRTLSWESEISDAWEPDPL